VEVGLLGRCVGRPELSNEGAVTPVP